MCRITANYYNEDSGSQFFWNYDIQQTIPSTVYSFTDPTGV